MKRLGLLGLFLLACSQAPPAKPPAPPQAEQAEVDRAAELFVELDEAIDKKLRLAQERSQATPPLSLTDKLVRELAHMHDVDSLLRAAIKWPIERRLNGAELDRFNTALAIRTLEIDRAHSRRVLALAEAHGWFRKSTVGEEADRRAWRLIRRSTDNRALQARAIELAQDAVAAKDTSVLQYATLVDEMAIAEDKPQEYGTQGDCLGPGSWEPAPTRDPDSLAERRGALGLPTAEESANAAGKNCL